jgi:Zn finger protein HypA/HybF involved in hydrogenase expression
MPVEPSVPGRVRCLSCDKDFKSPDKLRIRRCNKCKKKDAELSARELGLAAGDWPEGVRDELWRDQ